VMITPDDKNVHIKACRVDYKTGHSDLLGKRTLTHIVIEHESQPPIQSCSLTPVATRRGDCDCTGGPCLLAVLQTGQYINASRRSAGPSFNFRRV